jgi:hypothetical protein
MTKPKWKSARPWSVDAVDARPIALSKDGQSWVWFSAARKPRSAEPESDSDANIHRQFARPSGRS